MDVTSSYNYKWTSVGNVIFLPYRGKTATRNWPIVNPYSTLGFPRPILQARLSAPSGILLYNRHRESGSIISDLVAVYWVPGYR